MNSINETEVIERFDFYLQDASVGDAFEMILDDAEAEDLVEDQLQDIGSVLIDEIAGRFAAHYTKLDEHFGYEHSPSNVFHTFCEFNKIGEELKNALATRINVAVSDPHEDDEDVDSDNEVVFSSDNWKNLSDEEREQKLRAWLKKIGLACIRFG